MVYSLLFLRQQSATCTALDCVENITCTERRFFVSVQVLYVSVFGIPFSPSKKRKVTQSSKPDDHIEETLDLVLICL